MRSALALLLCLALFTATLPAQERVIFKNSFAEPVPEKPATPPPAAGVAPASLPFALYECDMDQCERGGGGAVWIFEGKEGQAMWHYQAVAKMTITKFDGSHISFHRADPPGTYSERTTGVKEFTADYDGEIVGNRISGIAYYGGYGSPTKGTWQAIVVGKDFCENSGCLIEPYQLSVLGRRALEAQLFTRAYQCFHAAALKGDADGKGFEAIMMMDGWGGKHTPAEILAALQSSAASNSYPGARGLATAYEKGVIVPRSAEQAAFWNQRAEQIKAAIAQQEASRANVQAGKVMSAVLIFGLMSALMGGGSGSSADGGFQSPTEEERYRAEQHESAMQCRAGDSYACGGAGESAPK
jgi:hypothetical protein